MENSRSYFMVAMVLLCLVGKIHAQDGPMVKFYDDLLNRQCKVLFSAQEVHTIDIQLVTEGGDVLLEESYNEKSIFKLFTLGDNARIGKYKFIVKFSGQTHEHDFEVMNEKTLRRESVIAQLDDLLNLTIEVKSYNREPLSVFLYKDTGEQLEYFFWEPENGSRKKTLNLSKYDAYEIKLEVMQLGDPLLVEKFPLY